MFKVRQRQIDAFLKDEERLFVERSARRLREHFPLELAGVGDEELLRRVREGVARAAGYGLRSYHDVALFLGLLVELGPDLDTSDRHAWARELLARPDLPPTTKVEHVYERVAADAAERRREHV